MENQAFATQCHEDGTITISSGTRLTIEHAVEFATCLGAALTAGHRVAVEFEDKVEVDFTTLQVLCSACKTAAVAGKALTPQGAGLEALRQLIKAAGAERLGPCRHNSGHPCLWFGGTH